MALRARAPTSGLWESPGICLAGAAPPSAVIPGCSWPAIEIILDFPIFSSVKILGLLWVMVFLVCFLVSSKP